MWIAISNKKEDTTKIPTALIFFDRGCWFNHNLKIIEMHRLILGTLFIFSLNLAQAQAPLEKSLLWEISGKGISKPSYLFGTIHLICPKDFSLSDPLKKAISKTEQLALEIDMDDPGLMGAMTKTMFMTGGKTLKGIFTETDYSRLQRFYQDSIGMDITTFDRAKPFVLMGPLFNKVLDCQPQSYEMELMSLANKQNSEVIGLETIEEQMAIFDTVPYTQQAKMLISIIDSLPNAKTEFHKLVELYKKQDLDALNTLSMKSEFGMDSQNEVMLFQRNKAWIDRIAKMITKKSTFIAVGAAHLGGERGVIALLRKEGYIVRAVAK